MSEQPSVEDLFALYRLCGGDAERVIELLARLWGTTPDAIKPTVYAWLGNMPTTYVGPPSRSRTAPPTLPSWFMRVGQEMAGGGRGGPQSGGGGGALLGKHVKPPPLSAPAAPGATHMPRTFDMLALQQAVERGSTKLPQGSRTRTLTLQPMPEEQPANFGAAEWMAAPPQVLNPPLQAPAGRAPPELNDDALGAFMYQSRVGKASLSSQAAVRAYGGRHMR